MGNGPLTNPIAHALTTHSWPKLQAGPGGQGESTYGEKAIVSGRVLCDTYLSARVR